MGLDSRKYIKYMVLVFLSAFISMQSSYAKNDMYELSRRLQEIVEKIEASEDLQEEEKLLQEEEKLLKELWAILGRFYTKIIEIDPQNGEAWMFRGASKTQKASSIKNPDSL